MDELPARGQQIAYLDGRGLSPSRHVLPVHQEGVAKPGRCPLVEVAFLHRRRGRRPRDVREHRQCADILVERSEEVRRNGKDFTLVNDVRRAVKHELTGQAAPDRPAMYFAVVGVQRFYVPASKVVDSEIVKASLGPEHAIQVVREPEFGPTRNFW